MINILMLSKWHVHAAGYARAVCGQPDARVSMVWDDDAQRGGDWAKELGVPFEPDLSKALANPDIDAVIVDTPTSDHCRVMVAAAEAGKHIFTEKVLAATLKDCHTIADAVKKAGVKLCISLPQLTTPLIQYCKQAVDEGLIGDVHYMRMRTAHAGSLKGWLPAYWYDLEKAGGGAMMDLGCHPMYAAAYLLGKQARIASMFNTTYAPPNVDDNSVCVVEFANKAIAVLETSFVSPYQAGCFELLGTEGAIVQVGADIKVRSDKVLADGWFTPDKLPPAQPIAIRQWLDGIINDTPIMFDADMGIALTELLENAYISDSGQKIVKIG